MRGLFSTLHGVVFDILVLAPPGHEIVSPEGGQSRRVARMRVPGACPPFLLRHRFNSDGGHGARCAFAHPHMGPFESSILTLARVLFLSQGTAAVRGAMRSAAYRRDRRARGLASDDLCSCSLHHLISGRTAMARTHIPHACGEEAIRMRPIYRTACFIGPRVARSSSNPR